MALNYKQRQIYDLTVSYFGKNVEQVMYIISNVYKAAIV